MTVYAGGQNNQVMFNKEGVLSGDPALTFDPVTKVLKVGDLTIAGDEVAASPVLQSRVILTPTQVKNLRVSPVIIAPAPGLNKILMLINVIWQLKFATTPYTRPPADPGTPTVYVGPSATAASWFIGCTAGLIELSQSDIHLATGALFADDFQTNVENVPIRVGSSAGAEFTVGDSELAVTVQYSIIDLA
jgi:hypothetical protein